MSAPELIMFDCGGLHNKDISTTRKRLAKEATWRRQRVIMIIPADAMIPAKCALAMMSLITPPNNGFVRILAQNCEVGSAYSSAIEQILAHPELSTWEWILTYEADNAAPPDGLLKLVEAMEEHPELSIIGGLYFCKGPNSPCQIWGSVSSPELNFRPQLPDPNGGLVECAGTGMGFTLYRLSMFKDPRLRRPWFVTQKGNEGVSTQDLYFASDCRKYGYRAAVHCGIKVGHWDAGSSIMW